jgi:type IV pilus assembly protein PilE
VPSIGALLPHVGTGRIASTGPQNPLPKCGGIAPVISPEHDMHSSFNRLPARSPAGGFSLIELMVTVAIVAILLGIAVPSYSIYMKRSRRGEAEAALMDIAQREQTYLLDQRAYAPDLATLNYTAPSDVQTFYNVTAANFVVLTAGPPPGFTLTLAPKAGTAQAGDYTLTIDNTGAKTPTNVW